MTVLIDSMLLNVHKKTRRLIRDGELLTATSTFTQVLTVLCLCFHRTAEHGLGFVGLFHMGS